MHIAEGVLSPQVLIAGVALGSIGLGIGLKNLKQNEIIPAGVMAALFFVGSLIHIPVGLSNAHLLLTGLTGVILGWAAFPAIFSALVLQAILFQYGGITTLGVNLTSMGYAAIFSRYAFLLLSKLIGVKAGAFIGGAFGVVISGLFTALALAFTHEGFIAAAAALFIAHLPVMLAEGLITMLTAGFLARLRPEILQLPKKLHTICNVSESQQ